MLAERGALKVEATPAAFEQALEELRKTLADAGLPRKVRYDVEVVFEEIVTNVVRHGSPGPEIPTVEVVMDIGVEFVTLVFTDGGIPFNPCEQAAPEAFKSLKTLTLGGLGISLVRKASTGMTYERTPQGENRLTVTVAARETARA